MAEIEIADETLTVRLRGWEVVWALRRRVAVPLARVRGARLDPVAAGRPKGFRWPGSRLPRVITAGTFVRKGGRASGASATPPRRWSSTWPANPTRA